MKNLKTTVSGLLVAVSSFLILNVHLQDYPFYYRVSAFVLSGGLGFLGISAKDSDD